MRRATTSGAALILLLTSMGTIVLSAYVLHLAAPQISGSALADFAVSIFDLINTMIWGVLAAIVFIGLIGAVPREFVTAVLGRGGTLTGVARAMVAGVLLDLCSHGILIVGARLYERGASLGQVMAFLIASPWNSLSLTLILWALIGLKWMLVFLLTSMAVAFVAGAIFDKLVAKGSLPANRNASEIPEDFDFFAEAKKGLSGVEFTPQLVCEFALGRRKRFAYGHALDALRRRHCSGYPSIVCTRGSFRPFSARHWQVWD